VKSQPKIQPKPIVTEGALCIQTSTTSFIAFKTKIAAAIYQEVSTNKRIQFLEFTVQR
jgi:hypothetical protein